MFFLTGIVIMFLSALFLSARKGKRATWFDGFIICLGFVGFIFSFCSVVYMIAKVMP